MLTIRLTRKGKKNQPFFRVVVIDKRRSASGGRPAEILGYIDPLTKKKSLKKDRILHWIKVGAQPSATVHNLLVSEKIIEAKKINKFKKSKKAIAAAKAAAVTASAPAPAGAAVEPAAPVPVVESAPVPEVKTETPPISPAPETPIEATKEPEKPAV
ncbi:MAG: 30S ribosomal protein S16 [Candidatus Yanofskybacteria bacterium RIFCSPHIGHO2_02_FULL_43_17]|uniref:Small ribosomal subunit protein bS16 n=1 Tax=Candidatus Staskawiczbacteria bacterium RIFCSPHIGHO2_12_FULL_38_11 TaxID=1802209 RepID=A0A1G2I7W4_9BACT|nr:MAG: 30S ribosomal protein S16 [Candidatus Yanofskybacteria bacterium RIFCSPHIGHO2_02_FULL_43_17]OGZ70707.1 MAG: 30S ribosomal protein S16 [Candidatus Staskawiczbacteria bacterium RIFCSPHIGHO2_12_FULL_38_11]